MRCARKRATLSPFDPATEVVQFDLAALLAGANVDVNQADTAAGCMSAGNDADCGGLFAALGLALYPRDASSRPTVPAA